MSEELSELVKELEDEPHFLVFFFKNWFSTDKKTLEDPPVFYLNFFYSVEDLI